MYINLILGGVFLVALWVLLHRLLVRVRPREDESNAHDAGAILIRELEERRARGKDRDAAWERLSDAGAGRLDLLETALEKMRLAMPGEERGKLSWVRDGAGIRLIVGKDGREHILALAWVVPDLDLGGLDSAQTGDIPGRYRIRDPEGQETFFADMGPLVRNIARFIADILA
jgi:hypothetical protein